MATARAATRMREVGMRKVLGADRVQLIFQFLGESIILTGTAVLIALIVVFASIPVMNEFLGRTLTIESLFAGRTLLLLGASSLLLSLLAGSYPAISLSRFNPINVLKNGDRLASGKSRLRQFLVVTQFVVSIVLIAATLVVFYQLDFMRNRKLGFEKEHVVNIPLRDARLLDSADAFKRAVLEDPHVVQASVSSTGVDEFSSSGAVRGIVNGEPTADILTGLIFIDEDYLDTFEMSLVAGRSFTGESSYASAKELLINEAFVRSIGWKTADDAIGQEVGNEGWGLQGEVIGVVKDFNIRSLRSTVPASIMINAHAQADAILSVKLAPGDPREAIARIKSTWSRIYPEWPFESAFLDDLVDARYKKDQLEGQLFTVFASLAILIACLGLFGLAAFMGQRRIREVGIRKVVGASTPQIMLLLSREFTILVGLAFVLATPIAFVVMDRWLGNYAFHIDLDWYLFASAGIIALVAAWVTISYQSFQSARSRPVTMLRSD